MAGRTGAFLAVHFLAGTVDLAAVLDVVGAALTFGELPSHAAVQEIRTRLKTKDGCRQVNRAGGLPVERHDFQFHVIRLPCRRVVRLSLLRLCFPIRFPRAGTSRAWGLPSEASSSPRRAR